MTKAQEMEFLEKMREMMEENCEKMVESWNKKLDENLQ